MTNELRPQVVVFCCSGLEPSEVEPDFEPERDAAVDADFLTTLVDHDEVSTGNAARGVRFVGRHDSGTCAIYRGWMLSVDRYQAFYEALSARGLTLINDPLAYKMCHWLPDSYHLIEGHTPESKWIPAAELIQRGEVDWERVLGTAGEFGSCALVLKDYVKSQKHHWHEACYIPRANDPEAVRGVVSRFLELQGEDLAGGLVLRRHVSLRENGKHGRSGMPLSDEYRLFFAGGRLLVSSCYWDVGQLASDIPFEEFGALAKTIPSRFFSMDVARGADGRWWIIELGDGQVAGLPPRLEASEFYRAAWDAWKSGLPDEAWNQIVAINDAFADGDFLKVSREGRAGRCGPEDLKRVVQRYPGTLIRFPSGARDAMHVYHRVDGTIAVDVSLWTEEEGRSDLTLSVECEEKDGGWWVSVSDLHVM